jgi:hypothetical protein
MRYMGMVFVFTAMVVMVVADSARGITGPASPMLVKIVVASTHKDCPPPPPPPPPRSKSCPCDSKGNPIDNCGKGNDSKNP